MYDELLSHENILLMTLGFDVQVTHPHCVMIKACELIKGELVTLILLYKNIYKLFLFIIYVYYSLNFNENHYPISY